MKLVIQSLLVLIFTIASFAESAEVINAGIGGHRSSNLVSRAQRDVISLRPTTVVLMVGTNDRLNSGGFVSIEQYKKNIELLIKQIKSNDAQVLLITPPPCLPHLLFTRHNPEKFAGQSPDARMQEVRKVLVDIGEENQVQLLDFHHYLVKNNLATNEKTSVLRNQANSNTTDGVHFTPQGYQLLARQVAQKLSEYKMDINKVICFGDSLTKGSTKANYPDFLQAILNRK